MAEVEQETGKQLQQETIADISPQSSKTKATVEMAEPSTPNKPSNELSDQKPEMALSSSSICGSSEDPMLGFLTLLAKVERPACANCESKDLSPMFFCNTCGQAICAVCKQNTHSAKMFSRHDVTSVSPYSKEPQRKCPVHHEMCIMFSPANESLLCINCFRDLPPDIRAQCLDLDTAYQQKCDRLQRGLKAVGELEVIIKDEVSAYRALLKELHINAMREESTIHVFSKILQGVVTQTEERLIEAVKSEIQTKEMVFEEKLKTLESLQSNVQAYLTLSTAFISSASKFELLKLANGLVERLSDIGNVVQPAKISPENSTISSNFKAEFSQSLKELLHQELWMHEHLSNLSEASTVPKNTGEETRKQPQVCASSNRVIQQPEAKVPLPFLGRSQSLLNIPLNLEIIQPAVIEPKIAIVQQPSPPQPTVIVPQPAVRRTGCSSNGKPKNSSKTDAKYQSLPHSSNKEGQKSQQHQHRRAASTMPHPVRSKSVEAKSAAAAAQQHQYDISQLELFATIHQSRQAVTSRSNSKNLTVTSALVGVRQSDRNGTRTEQKSGKTSETSEKGASANVKNPSGHVCVVQALVHQDGDVLRNATATSQAEAARHQQRQRNWEPVYEPIAGHGGRPKSEADNLSASEASIELTADQVRQLIRAISAAQSNTGGSIGGCWPSEMGRPPSNSSHIPERDVQAKPTAHPQRPLHRNDSFEGHEEAVRMLVGAIQEIQQLCTDKKQCEHPLDKFDA